MEFMNQNIGDSVSKSKQTSSENLLPQQDRFELRPERNRFSSGVRWLREHEYVRQDDERGTWSPNQFTVEQDRAA